MHHLTVASHALNLKAILDSLHAGIDSLEHASELNREAIDYMKAHHVWWDPTVYIVDTYVTGVEKGPADQINKGKILAVKHFASFKLGLQSGLAPQLLAGSDMKYEPGLGTVLDEMITLVKYGATPKQALIAATKNGAEAAGWDDMGTLAVGKQADFVALDGDPTEDISVVKKIKSVVFQGKVIVPSQ
jgi:imidazolonepropionase-like amidohydrolase